MSEMIVDSSKKRLISQGKLSWEDKVSLCKRWKESVLNKSQFCHKHGLALPTFCEWCKRVWPHLSKLSQPSMTPVRVIDKHEIEQQVVVELLLPNQATVKMSVRIASIGKLIEELCHATAAIR